MVDIPSVFGLVLLVNAALFLGVVYVVWRSFRALVGIERGIWAIVSQLQAERRELRSPAPVAPVEVKTTHGPADLGVHLSAFGR